jgi:hypothetical protein
VGSREPLVVRIFFLVTFHVLESHG